jgi:hypothetical protein
VIHADLSIEDHAKQVLIHAADSEQSLPESVTG